MNDTAHSLASRLHDPLVEYSLTRVSNGLPARAAVVAGERRALAERTVPLGPDARWIVPAAYSGLATIGLRADELPGGPG